MIQSIPVFHLLKAQDYKSFKHSLKSDRYCGMTPIKLFMLIKHSTQDTLKIQCQFWQALDGSCYIFLKDLRRNVFFKQGHVSLDHIFLLNNEIFISKQLPVSGYFFSESEI